MASANNPDTYLEMSRQEFIEKMKEDIDKRQYHRGPDFSPRNDSIVSAYLNGRLHKQRVCYFRNEIVRFMTEVNKSWRKLKGIKHFTVKHYDYESGNNNNTDIIPRPIHISD